MTAFLAALSGVWSFIQMILQLLGLIKMGISEADKAKVAAGQVNTQERDKAVDAQKNAQSEDEFDKAQDSIVLHKPKP